MTTSPAARNEKEPRVEDDALVRGGGRFMDDPRLPNTAYAVFVRSPHAHARVTSVNTDEARKAKKVLAVLTAADMKAANVGSVSRHPPVPGRGGAKMIMPFRPSLAGDRVMHVGDPVAMVVAETAAAAQDGADLVQVQYEELPAVIDLRDAMKKGGTQLYPEAPGNLCVDWPVPVPDEQNEREVDDILAKAPHVAKVSVTKQRMVVASMETRGATGVYDKANDSYTLYACSQGADSLRAQGAAIMGVPNEKLRVITEDVGGAFGMKTPIYPEYPALLIAAKRLGRPVHWMASRAESFLTDNQARDTFADVELALDENGKFQALRLSCVVNLGAYVGSVGVHLATYNFARCLPAMYRIPLIDVRVRCAFTNTVPTAPYRGAGRPEANYLLERVVEEAARITGIAPDKIRKRNLIPPSAIPYETPVGTTYDSGDFPAVFDKALALAAYADFSKRRREAGKRGMLRGIGIACFLEHAGGMPTEGAGLAFPGDGMVELQLGSQSTGQAHATVFPRVAAQQLGISADHVILRQGDSGLGVTSASTVASRSAVTAGTAVVRAAEAVIRKGEKLAADALEAAEADIVYDSGAFAATGTDRRIGLFDLATQAKDRKRRGEIAEDLDTKLTADTPQSFPNGCHIAEVEIDPETGATALVGYAAVDDCGNVLDHMIVEGQVHGAIVQGVGQVLLEHLVYDRAGQLVTGSFMDYAMPRADDVPPLTAAEHSVPATTTPSASKASARPE